MRANRPIALCCLLLSLNACESSDSASPGAGDAQASGDAADPNAGDTQDQGADDASEPADDADPGGPDLAEPPAFCEGATEFLYDPPAGKLLGAFPDDYWTVDDPQSPSGVRLHVPEGVGWIADVPEVFSQNVPELEGTPGFGCSAPLYLRFSAKVMLPTGPEVRLVELSDEGPVDVPYEATLIDDETTVVLTPHRPLRAAARHALVATNDFRAQTGECIAPSPVLQGLLAPAAARPPELERLSKRLHEALDALEIAPQDVSAAVVFTTQDPIADDRTVAADIRSRSFAWTARDCETLASGVRVCENRFEGRDYRGADALYAGGEPQAKLSYPVSIWLPKGEGPFPLLIFAHGIGADRSQAGAFAEFFAERGLGTVAIDAVSHGQHPAGSGGGSQADILAFFGVDLASFSIHARELRDHWRQSAWDKLQLVRVIEADPDLDGDKALDVDVDRIAYLGVSLGGIMGTELMALSDRIGAAVLEICGGYMTAIVRDSDQLGQLLAFGAPGASDSEIQRFLAMAQVILDAGDPVNYATTVFAERLADGGSRPSNVLFQVAIGDEVIPNSSSWALARAFGTPQIPPVVTPVSAVVTESMPLPVASNGVSGAATVGLFQFDRVTLDNSGKPVHSGHQTTPGSVESVGQALHFLQSWFDDGVAEIIDPYALYKTPPL